ncbi:MAG TPA: lmo0937 family membrane protein [Gemmatimonadaceae bacterium]|jgi:hypothetical protein|nr:lmo0937 family membrane protein [Gemmatimonadaceae bacterium]
MDLLLILIVLLFLGWGGGLAIGYTAGGLLHVLLVVAVILVMVRVLQGRSAW